MKFVEEKQTNISWWKLGVLVTFYICEYGDVQALYVYFSALPLCVKVCFPTSNYMNSPSFNSSYYFDSPFKFTIKALDKFS